MTPFDEFWAAYPRKVGKGTARKAYAKALKLADHAEIMRGLSQQVGTTLAVDTKFIPHPATWLNGERWEDEPEGGAKRVDTAATREAIGRSLQSNLPQVREHAERMWRKHFANEPFPRIH